MYVSPLALLLLAKPLWLVAGTVLPISSTVDVQAELGAGGYPARCPIPLEVTCADGRGVGLTLSIPWRLRATTAGRGPFVAPKLSAAFSMANSSLRDDGRGAVQRRLGASMTAGFDFGYRFAFDRLFLAVVVGASVGYGENVPSFAGLASNPIHASALMEINYLAAPAVSSGLVVDFNPHLIELGFWF